MIIIEDTIVSDDLLKEQFACNIEKCKGICCIEGDKGAPLEIDELKIIEENLDEILPHLDKEHQDFIKENGFYEQDFDGEYVTTCLDDGRCCFTVYTSSGALGCGIEKSYYKNDSKFLKPVSCHLYPVRVQPYDDFTAVNYHSWDICSDACEKGSRKGIKVFEFTKNALIRKFGKEWYKALVEAEKHLTNS